MALRYVRPWAFLLQAFKIIKCIIFTEFWNVCTYIFEFLKQSNDMCYTIRALSLKAFGRGFQVLWENFQYQGRDFYE